MLLLDVFQRPTSVFPQRHQLWSLSSVKMQTKIRTFCDWMRTMPTRFDGKEWEERGLETRTSRVYFWWNFFQMNWHLMWTIHCCPNAIWTFLRRQMDSRLYSFLHGIIVYCKQRLIIHTMERNDCAVFVTDFGQFLIFFLFVNFESLSLAFCFRPWIVRIKTVVILLFYYYFFHRISGLGTQ